MVLAFRIDPATGVYQPPVTVFNGGKRSKRKTRKAKGKRKAKKTMRRRH